VPVLAFGWAACRLHHPTATIFSPIILSSLFWAWRGVTHGYHSGFTHDEMASALGDLARVVEWLVYEGAENLIGNARRATHTG
jgi:hypothetical protein